MRCVVFFGIRTSNEANTLIFESSRKTSDALIHTLLYVLCRPGSAGGGVSMSLPNSYRREENNIHILLTACCYSIKTAESVWRSFFHWEITRSKLTPNSPEARISSAKFKASRDLYRSSGPRPPQHTLSKWVTAKLFVFPRLCGPLGFALGFHTSGKVLWEMFALKLAHAFGWCVTSDDTADRTSERLLGDRNSAQC